jgi:hypothetical protein
MITKELKWGKLAILSESDLHDDVITLRVIHPNSNKITTFSTNLDDWRKLNRLIEENVSKQPANTCPSPENCEDFAQLGPKYCKTCEYREEHER